MLTISLDGMDAIDRRLQMMMDRCAHAGDLMATELEAWQVEDMRRRYPNIQRPDQNTAVTFVWPRSRVVQRPEKHRRAAVIARARRVRGGGRRLAYSTRPILRAELLDKLSDRMFAMLKGLFS
jgi:hypothetical protein